MLENNDHYSDVPGAYAQILQNCIDDAYRFWGTELGAIQDIRLWTQKWPNSSCGFSTAKFANATPTLAPTIVIKFDNLHRLVYHGGDLAYRLIGKPTLEYYDAVRARKLPGANEIIKDYYVEN